jgi:hypothetical protein
MARKDEGNLRAELQAIEVAEQQRVLVKKAELFS